MWLRIVRTALHILAPILHILQLPFCRLPKLFVAALGFSVLFPKADGARLRTSSSGGLGIITRFFLMFWANNRLKYSFLTSPSCLKRSALDRP
jgi:hypothetical protein